MKRTNIYLDEDLDRHLRHYAIEQQRSFTDVVRQALEEFAAREGIADDPRVTPPRRTLPDAEWSARMDALLQQVHSRIPPDVTPEELEADITTAWEEYRAEREAQRQATHADA